MAMGSPGNWREREKGVYTQVATVVCVIASTGFKDTPSLDRLAGAGCPLVEVAEINW